MFTYRSYRTELRPNRTQEQLLRKHCGAGRFAYNWGLARRTAEFEKTGRVLTSIDLHRELNALKKTDLPWLYEVSKCAPHEALRDLDQAFKAFFAARRKRARWPRFPRFKKRRDGLGSFRLNGIIRIGQDWIQLPRLGRLRLKERSYLPLQPQHLLSATVSQRAGRWFVSVRVVEDVTPCANQGPVVGVDLGLERLATTSDGEMYPNPRVFRRFGRKVRRTQRRLHRRQKGGRNREKVRAELARLYLRIANTRSDHLHKLTTHLAKTKSVLVLEDLAVRSLLRTHRVGRGLADAGLGRFRALLEYKTVWHGSSLIIAPRMFPSSRMCSACGELNAALALGDRIFRCPSCGFVCDRDLNAAHNLAAVAGSSSETQNACGAGSAGRRESAKLPALNQELGKCSENGKVIGVSSSQRSDPLDRAGLRAQFAVRG